MNFAQDLAGARDMSTDSIAGRLFDLPSGWRSRAAFTAADGQLSFADLRQGMLAFAGWLKERVAVGHGDRVAICLPKTLEAVQTIYGIHAAGAAFVPLQFAGPPERLAAIIDSVKPRVLLTTADMVPRLAAVLGDRMPRTQSIETTPNGGGLVSLLAGTAAAADVVPVAPSDVATIIFTSGSTGSPKGVMIAHRSITRRVTPPFEWDEILESDRMILNAGLHYVGALDMFFPSATGCSAYLLSDLESMFADRIVDLMANERTTIWKSTATALRLLTENGHLESGRLSQIRRVEFVGEPLSMSVLRRAMAALPNALFVHRFGSTEAYRIAQYPVPRPLPADMESLPLGKPSQTYRLSLRDEHGRNVPPGECGEICVVGAPVMLGYWNEPALTASRRLDGREDSFRTGDLAILGEDGLLRWAGRRDQVVKIRGHRIDLGEIETVLRNHPGVQESAAFIVEQPNGGQEIRAAILATKEAAPLEAELKLLCVKRLPAAARPNRILCLEAFPQLPSGKVDRQALQQIIART